MQRFERERLMVVDAEPRWRTHPRQIEGPLQRVEGFCRNCGGPCRGNQPEPPEPNGPLWSLMAALLLVLLAGTLLAWWSTAA